jgi:zinc finger protein
MISRFECPHCNYSNRGVQFAGTFPPKGVHYHLRVSSPHDLNRRIIKSCHGVLQIPAIAFEIPGPTQGDSISTIEGVLRTAHAGLSQVERTPQLAEFLEQLDTCAKGLVQFDLVLDDPSGNSFIENPFAPSADHALTVSFFRRTPDQAVAIGLVPEPAAAGFDVDDADPRVESAFAADGGEVAAVPTDCPACGAPGENRSCRLAIPHFKEIVIMAFSCGNCGFHSGDIRVGGGISPTAKRVTLHARAPRDLAREVIKSEDAAVAIPECGLEILPGSLGGKFTTVEGLIRDVIGNLREKNPFALGDSAEGKQAFERTINALRACADGEAPFTLVIDDPLANSHIQEFDDAPGDVVIEEYERSDAQNQELGITDMRTRQVETADGISYVKEE